MKRMTVLAMSVVIAVFLLAGGVRLYTSEPPSPPRFSEVVPGKIYRSGQPTAEELQVLFKSIGLKAIVNLRGEQECRTNKECLEEAEFARENGVRLIVIGFGNPPTRENARDVLKALDDERNYPLLIHCEHGKERAGTAIAIYRMERMGWTSGQAAMEMLEVVLGRKLTRSGVYHEATFVAAYRPESAVPDRQGPGSAP